MLTPRSCIVSMITAAFVATTSHPASAQVIGTFRWQTQPYCNVVTLAIVQQGSVYQLTGSDDLCGSGTAAVMGTAVVAGGGIAMGIAVGLPSGRAAHLSTTINVVNLAGTWTDGDGNTGPFAFASTSPGGAPRPTPTTSAVITSGQLSPTIFGGSGSANTIARSDHIHDDRYYTESEINARSTVASFAQRNSFAINTSPTEAVRLTDGGAGGLVVVSTPARMLLNGAVTVGNNAYVGPFSMIDCWFETAANGGAFGPAGLPQSTESLGNTNHDQRSAIPLNATIDVAPGSYNVRIVCQDRFRGTGSLPVARAAAFSAIAVSR